MNMMNVRGNLIYNNSANDLASSGAAFFKTLAGIESGPIAVSLSIFCQPFWPKHNFSLAKTNFFSGTHLSCCAEEDVLLTFCFWNSWFLSKKCQQCIQLCWLKYWRYNHYCIELARHICHSVQTIFSPKEREHQLNFTSSCSVSLLRMFVFALALCSVIAFRVM